MDKMENGKTALHKTEQSSQAVPCNCVNDMNQLVLLIVLSLEPARHEWLMKNVKRKFFCFLDAHEQSLTGNAENQLVEMSYGQSPAFSQLQK